MKPFVRFLCAGILLSGIVPLFSETYIVTNTADSGPGSFRQAILDANTNSGYDLILFQIPLSDPNYNSGNGVWTIRPLTSLPDITQGLLEIDGGSQSRFIGSDTNPFGPEIELDGSLMTSYSIGLCVKGNDVSINELSINRFVWDAGIRMDHVNGGRIAGCVIGMDPTGMSVAANDVGISLVGCRNVSIVPAGENKPNIVSGNPDMGIALANFSSHNVIEGNLIGMNRTIDATFGNGLNNGYGGIYITSQSDSNTVRFNTIGGNKYAGIYILYSCGNRIENNIIGTNGDFSSNFSNSLYGIWLRYVSPDPGITSRNIIKSNIIGYNYYGVIFDGDSTRGNPLTENRISKSWSNGIEYNTNWVPDTPVILGVQGSNVYGTANPGSTIEVFTDEDSQGQIFLGSTSADDAGQFSLPLSGSLLANYTATATDEDGNTSPFSTPLATAVGPEEAVSAPHDFRLEQNHPNPFNPDTRIVFHVKERKHVLLEVFDTLGRKAATLIDGEREPGVHHADFMAGELPSGVYVYRIRMANFEAVKKMVLLE